MNPRPIMIRIILATTVENRAVNILSIIKGSKNAKLVTTP
jgi:hypothetical protein